MATQPCVADSICATDAYWIDCARTAAWPGAFNGYDTDAPHGCAFGPYKLCPSQVAWSISSSDTEPWATSGSPMPDHVFLWLYCAGEATYGYEMWLESTVPILSFEPMNGFVNMASADHLQILPPGNCVNEYRIVIGRINLDVSDPVSTEDGSWGRVKSLYK